VRPLLPVALDEESEPESDLPARLVEVYREPILDAAAAFGWRYRNVTEHGPAENVSPLAVPAATIAVADLLP